MMREVIARAMDKAWRTNDLFDEEHFAQAAIDAIHAAGFVIVPNQENQSD